METSNYHFGQQVGKGGMAVVYEGSHKSLGHKVAIKVLNPEFRIQENIRKRFIEEARRLARMNHPNLVKVTDSIEEGDMVAFVMEFIEGKNLRDYLHAKGRLGDAEIESFLGQMVDALNFVHQNGLVHRDIKPSNFLVTDAGQIKLLDFGIAKSLDQAPADYTQTGTGVQMGTPIYMSPEQVHGAKNLNEKSDQYSLGVVLLEMVSGRKPYDADTLSGFQIQSKIVNESLPLTGTHWDEVIQKATSKDPQMRFGSISGMFTKNPSAIETSLTDNEKTLVNSAPANVITRKSKISKLIWFILIGFIVSAIAIFLHFRSIKDTAEKLKLGLDAFKKGDFSSAYALLINEKVCENDTAQFYIGMMHLKGIGVAQDYSLAKKWFEKSANSGNSEAQFELGSLYDANLVSGENNQHQAFQWFKKSADAGNSNSQNAVAIMFFRGSGTQIDTIQSFKYLKFAVDQNNAKALFNMGWLYENGRCVKPNLIFSYKYYLRSAQLENVDGQRSLGLCFWHGKGIKRNFSEAEKWLRKAQTQGDPDSHWYLGILLWNGLSGKANQTEALDLLNKAVGLGVHGAADFLRKIGNKVPVNPSTGVAH